MSNHVSYIITTLISIFMSIQEASFTCMFIMFKFKLQVNDGSFREQDEHS
jgi:hypothetical protein